MYVNSFKKVVNTLCYIHTYTPPVHTTQLVTPIHPWYTYVNSKSRQVNNPQ